MDRRKSRLFSKAAAHGVYRPVLVSVEKRSGSAWVRPMITSLDIRDLFARVGIEARAFPIRLLLLLDGEIVGFVFYE